MTDRRGSHEHGRAVGRAGRCWAWAWAAAGLALGGALLAWAMSGEHLVDEFLLAGDLGRRDRLRDLAWYQSNHFSATIQYFGLSRLPGVGVIPAFRIVGAAAAWTAAMLGLVLAVRSGFLRNSRVPAAAAVVLTNHAFFTWGTFSLFQYAQLFVASVLAWWLLLRWCRSRFEDSGRVVGGTCLLIAALVFLHLGVALPIAAAGLVAVISRWRGQRAAGDAPAGGVSAGRAWATAAAYAATLAGSALVVRRFFTHAHLATPRSSIRWLYFAPGEADGKAGEALRYAVEHGWLWVASAVRPVEALGTGTLPLAVLLGVGVCASLFPRRGRVEATAAAATRCRTAWHLLLAVAAALAGGLAGVLPFGSVRYSLFLQIPLLLMLYVGLETSARVLLKMAGWTRRPADPTSPSGRSRWSAWSMPSLGLLVLAAAVAWPQVQAGKVDRRQVARVEQMLVETRHLPTVVGVNAKEHVRYLGQLNDLGHHWTINSSKAQRMEGAERMRNLRELAAPRIRTVSMWPWPRVSPIDGRPGRRPSGNPRFRPDTELLWIALNHRPIRERAAGNLVATVWERRDPLPVTTPLPSDGSAGAGAGR